MLSRFICLSAILFLALMGCQEDPCTIDDCGFGECLEGECVCDSLYEGDRCDRLERDKFLGIWTTGDICSSGSEVYGLEILNANSEAWVRFSQLGPDRLSVLAQVEGERLEIFEQAYGLATVTGSGGLDTANQQITLDYTVDYGSGNIVSCLTSLEK